MFNLYTHIKTNYFRFSIIINYIYEVYYILKKIIMPSKRTQIHFRYLLFSTVLLGLWSSQTVAFANENVTTKSATITTTSESTTQTSTVSEPSSQLEKNLTIPLDKKYLFPVEDYTYTISNPKIATISGRILIPNEKGTASITVKDATGRLIDRLSLTISDTSADTYTRLLSEWSDILTGNKAYDTTDSHMTELFKRLENKTKESLAKDQSGFLSDISHITKQSSNMTSVYQNVEDLAKQITNEKSAFYRDNRAIRRIKESLEWLYQNIYNPDKTIENGNWWDYEIGTPRALVNTLAMLQDYFSQKEINRYVTAVEKFGHNWKKTFDALGGNLVDMGRVKLIAGLLTRKSLQQLPPCHACSNSSQVAKDSTRMAPTLITQTLPTLVPMEMF